MDKLSLPKSAVDATKITGPYPLLTVFLFVVESILLAWLVLAQDGTERMVAGVLIVVILLAFLAVVAFGPSRWPQAASPPSADLGSGIAHREATPDQEASPARDEVGGPDGSYIISVERPGWTRSVLTRAQALADTIGVTDPAAMQALTSRELAPDSSEFDVLRLRWNRGIPVRFMPGTSMLDGRLAMTALRVDATIGLTVMPMDRAPYPLFVPRTFEHNYLRELGITLGSASFGLRTFTSDGRTPTGRKRMTAVLGQTITGATVDGNPLRDVEICIELHGVEGEVRDHLLTLTYVTLPGNPDPEIEQQTAELKRLADSFAPRQLADPDAARETQRRTADEKFARFTQENGERTFFSELTVALLRLAGQDLSDPERRLSAIRELAPLEALANAIGLQNEDVSQLWAAMHEAEQGDPAAFKSAIQEWLERALAQQDEQAGDSATGAGQSTYAPTDTPVPRAPSRARRKSSRGASPADPE